MTRHTGEIRVGRVVVPVERASAWVRDYTNAAANAVSEHPYAFPAYDCFDGDTREPGRLTDGDLLAPGLLNVPVKIRSFYGLQRVRARLEEALRNPILGKPLADVRHPADLRPAVRALYEVLDDPTTRPWGVGATTLSKVLHRKRPHSVVLHDRWVHACYVGDGAPVPHARDRTQADYMVLLTEAIRDDITSQPEAFGVLRAAAGGQVRLSDVRLLDILAWNSKGDDRVLGPGESRSDGEGSTARPPPRDSRRGPRPGLRHRRRETAGSRGVEQAVLPAGESGHEWPWQTSTSFLEDVLETHYRCDRCVCPPSFRAGAILFLAHE
ncbi:DUF6308 family protein [Terrabacter sp. Ter38]|uniref:DUF6308 family protein n=1 Tax=Terrabacter sp. Ter38 TaxID=2926030 RepID=UPI0035AE089B